MLKGQSREFDTLKETIESPTIQGVRLPWEKKLVTGQCLDTDSPHLHASHAKPHCPLFEEGAGV